MVTQWLTDLLQIGRIASVISGKTDPSGEPLVDERPWWKRIYEKISEFL